MPPPIKIFVHDHWLVNNRKMSKSFGNVIYPYWDNFSKESVRLYFLADGP